MNMIRAVIGVMAAAIVAVVATTSGGQAEVASPPTVPVEREVQPSDPPNYLQEAKFEGVRLAAERRKNIYIWTVAVEKNRLAEEARIAEARRVEAAKKAAQQRVTTAAASAPVRAAVTGDVWSRLAQCESGNTNANTGNGYYGYFQFSPGTWRSVGGSGLPSDHGYGEQLHRAQILQARSGWGQWPACSRKLGLR